MNKIITFHDVGNSITVLAVAAKANAAVAAFQPKQVA